MLTHALVSEHPNSHDPTYNEKPSHKIGSYYSSKGRTNSLLMLIVLRLNVQQAHKTVVCGVCSHTQALILENHKYNKVNTRKYDPYYIKYKKWGYTVCSYQNVNYFLKRALKLESWLKTEHNQTKKLLSLLLLSIIASQEVKDAVLSVLWHNSWKCWGKIMMH